MPFEKIAVKRTRRANISPNSAAAGIYGPKDVDEGVLCVFSVSRAALEAIGVAIDPENSGRVEVQRGTGDDAGKLAMTAPATEGAGYKLLPAGKDPATSSRFYVKISPSVFGGMRVRQQPLAEVTADIDTDNGMVILPMPAFEPLGDGIPADRAKKAKKAKDTDATAQAEADAEAAVDAEPTGADAEPTGADAEPEAAVDAEPEAGKSGRKRGSRAA